MKSDAVIGRVSSSRLAKIELAHGKAHVLAVGISHYQLASGFKNLRVCSNDALSVRDRFLDIKQLHADPAFCTACTSESRVPPSRGEIIRLLNELSDETNSNQRLIFFYSGHGVRLNNELYLVPQDAYSSTTPDALLGFSRVTEILSSSSAKQKIIILDACHSGPDVTTLKRLPEDLSHRFMMEYLANTRGTVVLASSGIQQASTVQSPNPKLSLFTHYFCEALAGVDAALDEGRLTLSSLYDYVSVMVRRQAKSYHQPQHPTLLQTVEGTIVLADFTTSVLVPVGIDLCEHPLTKVSFSESERGRVADVLRNIRNWSYTQEYLAAKVNDNLTQVFGDRFGKYAASLTEDAGIPAGEVAVESDGVSFPEGRYVVKYKAIDKKTGVYRHSVVFKKPWFDQPDRMILVLSCFDLRPKEMKVSLARAHSLESMIAGLNSRGWTLESNKLPDQFSASNGRYTVVAA
jgi:hypothetical protein